MKILAIDTTHGESSLALWSDGVIVHNIVDAEENKQAEHLVPLIEKILQKSGILYKDLSAVAVNIGPGSFTGVRIGMAAANGIKLVCGLPLIGVTSFESVAVLTSSDKNALVVLDAHRGQVYCQVFSAENIAQGEPVLIEYSEIYTVAPKDDFILIGNGAELVKDVLTSRGFNFTIESPLAVSAAENVVEIAVRKFNKGEHSSEIVPLYIRSPDAKTSAKNKK